MMVRLFVGKLLCQDLCRKLWQTALSDKAELYVTEHMLFCACNDW